MKRGRNKTAAPAEEGEEEEEVEEAEAARVVGVMVEREDKNGPEPEQRLLGGGL